MRDCREHLFEMTGAVMARCEWGKDDYSLRVENLPQAPHPNPEKEGEKKAGQIQLEMLNKEPGR